MKKILLIITKSNWGGAQKYVYDLATMLSTNDFKVKVLLGGEGELKQKLIGAGVEVDTIDGLGYDIDVFSDFKVAISLFKNYRDFKPDIIHINSSKIGGLGSFMGRVYNFFSTGFSEIKPAKIIFTAHGWAFNEDRSEIEKLIIKFFHWLTIVFAHQTIAVSNMIKKQIIDWPFIEKKITVIWNGVSPANYLTRENARQEIGRSAEKFLIGTIAELHHVKGYKYAIEAMATLKKTIPNIAYIIIGEGVDRKNLEKHIADLELQNYVFLLGHISEAPKLLKAFDIFILPSISEGLSYSILEAGFAELPVIASDTGGIPEIISHNETGMLVPIRNPNSIAQTIAKLHENQELSKSIAQNLYQKVNKHFTKEEMIRRTAELY